MIDGKKSDLLDEFEMTNDFIVIDEVIEMYEFSRSEAPDVIAVCDGEWRREGAAETWRFWANPARAA
jgi:hypothetical protein